MVSATRSAVATAVQEVFSELERLAESTRAGSGIPGLFAAIVGPDGFAWRTGIGTANPEIGTPPDASTVFRVASITKTFTATAILQLRDAGMLTLDDPLLAYLPEFTIAGARAGALEDVSIRRLLTHYSGLPTEHPRLDWERQAFPSMQEILDNMAEVEVVIPPDSQWKYSNLALSLLGEVIKRVTGRPYADYVRDEIIRPLNLSSTAYNPGEELRERMAAGFIIPLPGQSVPRTAPYFSTNGLESAGQLHSCGADLATWIQFQLTAATPGDGGEVLSRRTLREMHRPQYLDGGWTDGQAVGWRVKRIGEHVLHHHGGGIHGFSSNMVFNVSAGCGSVVLANLWPVADVYPLAEQLLTTVLDALARLPSLPEPTTTGEPASEDLLKYAGEYWAEPGVPVRIEVRGATLRLLNSGPASYGLHAPATLLPEAAAGHFRVVEGRGAGELAAFSIGPDGDPTAFVLGGFHYHRQR